MTPPQSMLDVGVLLTEDQLAGEFAAALARHELPEKFFYWFPTSVRAWLDLCSDGAYRNFVRSRTLIDAHAAAIARQLSAARVTVVSLGAGQGVKDRLVLEALRLAGRAVAYVPVDASQSLLEMGCAAALAAGVAVRGVKADLADGDHLRAIGEAAGAGPRLFMMLGNTLGAFDPPVCARQLAGLLRAGDHLLVDGEVYDPSGTLAGYDNPLNRQFAFGPLRALGLTEPADGVLAFEAAPEADAHGVYRLRKSFQPARALTLSVAGETIRWPADRRVDMNWSGKYAPGAFLPLLEAAGLQPVARYVSADDRFEMALVRAS
ncbi:MAG: L-histidine N(alpha)-methyltransferase [Vicinamibacterales bacterium]